MESIRKNLADLLCLLDVEADSMPAVFHEVLPRLVERGVLDPQRLEAVREALLAREADVPTTIGHAVALPHAYLEGLSRPCVAFVRLSRAVDLGAPDGIPTRFVFLLFGPPSAVQEHVETLTYIARLMSDERFRSDAAAAASNDGILAALDRFAERTAPRGTVSGAGSDEALEFTGKLGGGLLRDIRRRLPHYAADLRDGLDAKVLASITFLFFACLAPAVTFGGVMSLETEGHIGAVEMIAASAVCGVVYALLSGQPLIILGGTGPLLVFTAILYSLCRDLGTPFLPTYAYVGLWIAAILVVMALTDSSALMRFFTRFTDEIFAALISLIFIYQATTSVVAIFVVTQSGGAGDQDKAFLSLILTLATFFIALNLSRFRRSRFLIHRAREFFADFGPTIALGLTTAVAVWYRGVVDLDVLQAPNTFGPTLEGRDWFVNPFEANLPKVVWYGAPIPAVFAAILIYLDQNITSHIVNSPDHRLARGAAYHLDLAVVGGLVAVCSMFGLPWLVAATVRSLNHVRSLATTEEIAGPDGERQDRVVAVQENRLSPLAIHVLIGSSLLALPVIKLIPIPVLLGLFLFMGVVSIKGNQFFERLSLWLMDPSRYPPSHYMRRVHRRQIHLFTTIQLACLTVLWFTKMGPPMIAIFFPLFIALIAPLRLWIGRFFDDRDLEILDADALPEEEAEEWV